MEGCGVREGEEAKSTLRFQAEHLERGVRTDGTEKSKAEGSLLGAQACVWGNQAPELRGAISAWPGIRSPKRK